MQHFVLNPHTSTRKVAEEVGISQSTVERILKRHCWRPYKAHLVQDLSGQDFQRRIDFCLWLEAMEQLDPGFCGKILWSDEASFSRSGVVNRHNCHYWAAENPHWTVTAHFQVSMLIKNVM